MTPYLRMRFPHLLSSKTAFFISTAALAFSLLALTCLAAISKTPVWRLTAAAIAAHLVYGLCLFFAWKMRGAGFKTWSVMAFSLGMRLILAPAPPAFSDDVFRYVWDGRTLIHGINPYRFVPDDPKLEEFRDRYWPQINHKSLRTIYPPLGEAVFGAVALLCPHPHGFKIFSAFADVGVVYMVILLAGAKLGPRGDPPDPKNAKTAALAGLAYGLNPLACIETGMSGHLDPAAIFLLLLALYFLKQGKSLVFATLIGLGAGIKLAPILALPMVRQRRLAAWLICSAVVIAAYLPFASAGLGTLETLDTFARRWEGNAGLFSLINWSASAVIGALAGVTSPDSMVHMKFLDAPAAALQDTFFSLHKDGGFDPSAPGAFALRDLSLAASKLVLGLGFIGLIIGVSLKRLEPVRAAAWIFGALVIATPVMHPWYLLWILPLAAVLGHWPWMVFAALAPLSYLPLDGWWSHGVWSAPSWIQFVEWGSLTVGGAFYFFISSNRRKKS